MYSQTEIDEAVAAGAISAEAASGLRAFVERQRALPTQDEEQFRLLTGFNDIFVAIAAAILLFAVGFIGQYAGANLGLAADAGNGPSFLAPAFVAATSWALALFFTARRRMALPSIMLLLAFVAWKAAWLGRVERPADRAVERFARHVEALGFHLRREKAVGTVLTALARALGRSPPPVTRDPARALVLAQILHRSLSAPLAADPQEIP